MRALAANPRRRGQESCKTRKGLQAAPPRRVEVDLTPQAVELISTRVAQLLGERAEGAPKLLSAGELALRLGVERPWVYRHRHLLGGIRMGAGPKAPWRFDYRRAVEALEGHHATPLSYPESENKRSKP